MSISLTRSCLGKRGLSHLGAVLLAGCLSFSACNPFSDPETVDVAPNFNPMPEGTYFFSGVSSGWAFGNGSRCSLDIVRRPIATGRVGRGTRAFQDETRRVCTSYTQGVLDSTYAYSSLDTLYFHQAGGNLIMDSVHHLFGYYTRTKSFPQSDFHDSGSGSWKDCVYSGGSGTLPGKRFLYYSRSGLPFIEDTIVVLRGTGLLFYLHRENYSFHGVSSLSRIRLQKIIRGRDTLNFDGILSP